MPTMLPATPKSFGDVQWVFSSALEAVLGESNYFGFPQSNQVVAILVDGLGASNVKQRAGHAPTLNRLLKTHGSISVGFPTTTSTSITSFATGMSPGDHGIVGYRIREPNSGKDLNFLRWGPQWDPRDFASHPTISERAVSAGVRTYVVGLAEYEKSAFTSITMPNVEYVAATGMAESFSTTQELLRRKERSLVYLYVPFLDQTAHAQGWQSPKWSELLEDLDAEVAKLEGKLQRGQAALLTADHGVVDVDARAHIYFDEIECLRQQVDFVGGDTRAPMLYLNRPNQAESLVEELRVELEAVAYVLSRDELVATGWFGDLSNGIKQRLGDITIIARSLVAFYHRDFASANSLKMIGHHGALSGEELMVPLLRLGQFA